MSRFQLRHPPQPQHTVACFGSARTRKRYAGLHSLLLSPLREFTSYRSASWSCTWYMELVGNWIWVSYLFWLLHGIKLAAWKNLLFRFSQLVLWFIKNALQGLFKKYCTRKVNICSYKIYWTEDFCAFLTVYKQKKIFFKGVHFINKKLNSLFQRLITSMNSEK